MRAFLVAACILIASSYARADEKTDVDSQYLPLFADAFPKCMEEAGLPKGELKAMHDQLMGLQDKHNIGCVQNCLLEKAGMKKDGALNVDKLKEAVASVHEGHPEMSSALQKGVEECVEEVKDVADKCDSTLKFGECFRKKHEM